MNPENHSIRFTTEGFIDIFDLGKVAGCFPKSEPAKIQGLELALEIEWREFLNQLTK